MEREFHAHVTGMGLPDNVSVKPTKSFEDKGCTIEIRADSWEEAENIVRSTLRNEIDHTKDTH